MMYALSTLNTGAAMPETVSLSFRVAAEKARQVEELAKATERPKSWLLEQALDAYLDVQAWQIKQIQEGLDALRRGEVVEHEKVVAWLSTWGTDREGKPPW